MFEDLHTVLSAYTCAAQEFSNAVSESHSNLCSVSCIVQREIPLKFPTHYELAIHLISASSLCGQHRTMLLGIGLAYHQTSPLFLSVMFIHSYPPFLPKRALKVSMFFICCTGCMQLYYDSE